MTNRPLHDLLSRLFLLVAVGVDRQDWRQNHDRHQDGWDNQLSHVKLRIRLLRHVHRETSSGPDQTKAHENVLGPLDLKVVLFRDEEDLIVPNHLLKVTVALFFGKWQPGRHKLMILEAAHFDVLRVSLEHTLRRTATRSHWTLQHELWRIATFVCHFDY